MSVSLDGYIVGPDGDFGWTAPDEEVYRFWIDEIRGIGPHLGRRLYETMLYWETANQVPSLAGHRRQSTLTAGPLAPIGPVAVLRLSQPGGSGPEALRFRAARHWRTGRRS